MKVRNLYCIILVFGIQSIFCMEKEHGQTGLELKTTPVMVRATSGNIPMMKNLEKACSKFAGKAFDYAGTALYKTVDVTGKVTWCALNQAWKHPMITFGATAVVLLNFECVRSGLLRAGRSITLEALYAMNDRSKNVVRNWLGLEPISQTVNYLRAEADKHTGILDRLQSTAGQHTGYLDRLQSRLDEVGQNVQGVQTIVTGHSERFRALQESLQAIREGQGSLRADLGGMEARLTSAILNARTGIEVPEAAQQGAARQPVRISPLSFVVERSGSGSIQRLVSSDN